LVAGDIIDDDDASSDDDGGRRDPTTDATCFRRMSPLTSVVVVIMEEDVDDDVIAILVVALLLPASIANAANESDRRMRQLPIVIVAADLDVVVDETRADATDRSMMTMKAPPFIAQSQFFVRAN
jgi:hypothetical protein